MIKQVILNHFLPICIAITLVFGGLYFIPSIKHSESQIEETIIHGKQTKLKGRYGTILNHGEEGEWNFMASMANKSQLTIFGSSEFCTLNSIPYNFFPDSLGRQFLGIGHAHHQHLSIFI
jgi:hypothetical protein